MNLYYYIFDLVFLWKKAITACRYSSCSHLSFSRAHSLAFTSSSSFLWWSRNSFLEVWNVCRQGSELRDEDNITPLGEAETEDGHVTLQWAQWRSGGVASKHPAGWQIPYGRKFWRGIYFGGLVVFKHSANISSAKNSQCDVIILEVCCTCGGSCAM